MPDLPIDWGLSCFSVGFELSFSFSFDADLFVAALADVCVVFLGFETALETSFLSGVEVAFNDELILKTIKRIEKVLLILTFSGSTGLVVLS